MIEEKDVFLKKSIFKIRTGTLIWILDNGILSISSNYNYIQGHGYEYYDDDKMPDYEPLKDDESNRGKNERPWSFYLENIISVIIKGYVTSIGNYAFCECIRLKSVEMKHIQSIGKFAFFMCGKLLSISIPEGLKRIEERAFMFSGLTSIFIPKSVVYIGESVFEDCSNLISIEVDNENPFYSSEDGVLFNKEKTKLICYPGGKKNTEYIIPDGVITIENMNCKNLFSITIPSSIEKLESGFFYSGGSLQHIYMKSKIPPEVNGFWNLDSTYINEFEPLNTVAPVLHVPNDSKNEYINKPFWGNFQNIREEKDIPMVKILNVLSGITNSYGDVYYNIVIGNVDNSETTLILSYLSKEYLDTLKGEKLPGEIRKVRNENIDSEIENRYVVNYRSKFFPAKNSDDFYSIVTVQSIEKRISSAGKSFYAVIIHSPPIIYSLSNGHSYLSIYKWSLPSNLSLSVLQPMIGKKIEGRIKRVPCEPYEWIAPNTGKKMMLDWTYEYFPIKDN